jgi:hypothetical protein
VRTAVLILFLVVSLAFAAVRMDLNPPAQSRSIPIYSWRRTQEGWERAEQWFLRAPARTHDDPRELPHPCSVAAAEFAAASCFLLLGELNRFTSRRRKL